MKNKLKMIFLNNHTMALILLLTIITCPLAYAAKYNSDDGYQGNSLQEYEEFQMHGGGYDDCFSSGKVTFDATALENTSIPNAIGKDVDDTDAASVGTGMSALMISRLVGYSLFIANPVGLLAAAIDYAIMVDVCSNTYVMTADEWATLGFFGDDGPSLAQENICKDESGTIVIDPAKLVSEDDSADGKFGKVFTSTEIPYFFHCDPNYDPATGKQAEADKVALSYGYAGEGSQLCQSLPAGMSDSMKPRIGKIMVGYWPKISRGWYSVGGDVQCRLGKHSFGTLQGGEEKYIGTIHYYAFYKMTTTGKIRLCAIAPYTMMPVIVGCSTIAPPQDLLVTDPFIESYVANTRCAYLLKGREDLKSLVRIIGEDPNNSVHRFLKSDLHLTSTVVGCIKDLLMQIFMTNPAVSNNPAAPKPFFQVVQERFKQIVLAALTLYVALIGLKIITAGQPPSRGEAVMYVVKFGLVLFFATGDAWYRIEDGKRVGIYPAILDTSEELASIFLEAQNVNDPLKMCYLPYGNNGQNILANKDISIGTSGTATEGYPGYIKTTVWDLVDCKVVNYLSFGSCDYSLKGLMSAWLGAGMIFTNFALAISLIIYSIMTLITVFKFAHIFILSMFTITILVFLSPIFILFALFEPTKAMFQSWMKMIIGYMLYPALLFAFVAIMFATFDSIMYGDLDFSDTDIEDASNAPTTTFENIRADTRSGIKAACAKVRSSSIYCENLAYAAVPDPCVSVGSALSTDLIEKKNVTGFGDYQKVSDDYASAIQPHVGKMLLFSFLFYLFLGSITEFMAAIVGVRGLGNESQGLSAPLAPMKMAAGAAASKIAGGAARAVGKRAAGNKRN